MRNNAASLTLLAMTLDGQIADIRSYVNDLEALVRWFARAYEYVDPETGETVRPEPIFGYSDLYGNDLPEGRRLAATWAKAMRFPDSVGEEEESAGDSGGPYTERG